MKKISKHVLSLMIGFLFVLPLLGLPLVAGAQTINEMYGFNAFENGLGGVLPTGQADARVVAGRLINVAMGFLGVIAVGIILLGGFKWMTAGGNDEKTGEAKKLLGAGLIGVVIIFAAWGIAQYVLTTLLNQLNN